MSDDKRGLMEEQSIVESKQPQSGRRYVKRYDRRRGDIRGDGQAPPWLISFTDIMALMLTFFVLLYAMSEPEEKSWSEVMAALQKEFHVFYGPRDDAGPNDVINLQRVNYSRALPLDYLKSLLETSLNESGFSEQVSVTMIEDSLILSLSTDGLFQAGTANVNDGALRALYKLGTSLSKMRNRLEIIGHSDPKPITAPNSAYLSNWELSLERAASIASILERRGYTQPIMIKGYSHGRYQEIEGSVSEELKDALSRRVDVIIMSDDGRRTLEQRLQLE